MLRRLHTCATVAALLFSTAGAAQQSDAQQSVTQPPVVQQRVDTFSVDFDMLTRGEVRKGGMPEKSSDDFAAFIIDRTLLGVNYKRPGLTARITAQHSGTWGSNETNNFNIYETWVQLKSKNGFFAKVGRQNLSYDDQRIFGADDWAMTAMSHDALKLGYEGHGHKVHVIGAFNQNVKNIEGGTFFTGGLQPYKALQTIWYHYDFTHVPLSASLLFSNIGMQGNVDGTIGKDTCTYQQQIMGTYITFKPKRLNAEAAFYMQTGKDQYGLPVLAWMASAKAEYDLNKHLNLYVGYDYMSGDENYNVPPKGMIGMMQHKKIHGFSSLYGSHHKFYGAMDFFYLTTYYGGLTPGLQNFYLGTKWKPFDKLTLNATYHYLTTAVDINNASRSLGHELEVTASYRLLKEAELSAGYSFMRGTDTMKLLKRTTDDRQLQWAWVMFNVYLGK